MSDYNQALAAMIQVAGGIVGERSFLEIRNSAERALKRWIQDIVNQPTRAVPTVITDLKIPLPERRSYKRSSGPDFDRLPPFERRSHKRAPGPAFERLPPAETFPAPEIRAI